MPMYRIAHIREQGVDLIIVPMDGAFGNLPRSDQGPIIADLQAQCRRAGLAGTVVPVWDYGHGQMGFMAPENWHPFFQSINLSWIFAKLNRELHIFAGPGIEQAAIAMDIGAMRGAPAGCSAPLGPR
jgi:hypothetical protein